MNKIKLIKAIQQDLKFINREAVLYLDLKHIDKLIDIREVTNKLRSTI